MKTIRYIFLAMFMGVVAVSMKAQQRNILQVPDMRTQTGSVQLPIAIENTDEIVGAQFDITLPSGITANTAGTMSNRSDGHSVTITKVSSGAYRVLLHSTQNRPLRGQSGTVMYLPINIPSSFQEGSDYSITVEKAVLGTSTGENVLTDVSVGKIYILKLPDLTLKSITCDKQTFTPGDHIVVSWQVQNIGELATGAGWGEQISLVSEDGSQSKLLSTTHYDEILGPGGVVSRQAEIAIPDLLGIDGQARLQVRIVPDSKTGEPASAQANNTQQGANLLTIEKVLTFELSPTRVDENRNTRVSLKVTRSGRWTEAQTFSVTATADSRVPVPAEITIPANQASSIVYFNIVNNDVLDNDSIVNISVGGNGYSAVQQTLIIVDDEYPALSLKVTPNVVNEGDSIIFMVTAQRAPSSDVPLHLTCDMAKRFELPTGVFLKAGQTSARLVAYVKDDDEPSTTKSPEFTVAADGYVSAKVVTILYDNDVPAISLSLTPTVLSESAGPVAMIAVLRRTTHTDKDITVRLSDDSEAKDINYGQFSSVSMSRGVEEVEFTIGINDNLYVDGDRDVKITAAVYIQSCSCSASGEDAGVVSQSIHIVDDDGPSLTLTSSRSMILEGGAEGTVLTVSRNTSIMNPLTVHIASDYDEGLTYTQTAVIPAGERTVSVVVKATGNLTENDNTTVNFIATAEGHSDGVCWLMVSDQTMPDAVLTSMELLTDDGQPIGTDDIMVGDWLQARVTVGNMGVTDLPAGTIITFYQNSNRVATQSTSSPIIPGQNITLTYRLKASDRVGTLSAFAKVNEDQKVRELIYANNSSPTASVNVSASFTVSLSVDQSVIHYGDSVTFSGHLNRIADNDGKDNGVTDLDFYLIADGQRFVQRLQTDENGSFTYKWGPSRYQMGHISVGACYPDEGIRDEMVGVDIYGIRRISSRATTFNNVLEQPYSGSISIVNPGRLPLTGFRITVIDNPDEASIIFDAPSTIDAGQTVNIGYTLTGHKIGRDNSWQTLTFSMTTNENVTLDHTLYYYTRNPEAQLSCSVKQINTNVTKGYARDYSFEVANIGMGSTGLVTLALPQWMQSVTPMQMPSMAKGDTIQVVVRMMPSDDMLPNVPVTGQLAVNCENGNGLVIPFKIEPVSENTGDLTVDVCDEYTYYTAEAPHVSGATVSLLHPTTGAVIAKDTTDVSGCFNVTLPEGYYTLLVTHPKHKSYRANILLDPGKTTYKVVNLTYDAIDVSWDVVETTVEDVYDIVTTVKYETQVPVPVVTVNLPQNIEAHKLDEGESLVFYTIVTNKGLIAAEEVEFSMPEGYTELLFEPLDYGEPFYLAPQQSVTIPVKVTRLPYATSLNSKRRIKPLSEDDCYAKFPLAYYYICGTDRKYHKYWNGLRIAECEGKEIPVKPQEENGTYADGWNWGRGDTSTGGVGRPNYPGFVTGTSNSAQTQISTAEPYECNPCAGLGLWHFLKILPIIGPVIDGAETLKDIYNCGFSLALENGIHDKLANCKYSAGAVQRFDRFIDTGKAIYDDFGLAVDGAIDIVALTQNGQFFTQDCLYAWKDVFNGLYHAGKDITSFSEQAMSYADDVQKMSDQVTDGINYLQSEKKAWEEGNARVFFATEDQVYNNKIDHEQEDKARRDAKAQQLTESVKEQLNTRISTQENYDNLLEEAVSAMQKGQLSREDFRKFGQDGVRVLGDGLYHVHNEFDKFRNNRKSMMPHDINDYLETGEWDPFNNVKHASNKDNPLLKLDYLDATEKLVEKSDDVMDMLYYLFGGCDYEGEEGSSQSNSGNSGYTEESGFEGGSAFQSVKRRQQQSKRKASGTSYINNTIPWEYLEFIEKAKATVNMVRAHRDLELEFFGDSEWMKLTYFQTAPVAWAIEQVEKDGATAIDNPNISIYCPDGVSLEMMQKLLRRWYNTFYVPKNQSALQLPELDGSIQQMNLEHMEEIQQRIKNETDSILSGGETSIETAVAKPFRTAVEKLNNRSKSVCASITLQFNQTMTMTRQAFRGTLKVHNGNADGAMENVILQLEVRNASDGSLATSREMYMGAESLEGFEGALNLTDGWTLAANGDGTATILFIPSKYAAPTEAQDYSFGGRLSYLDPFSGTVVTRELSPITLTVKPSPELDLTYFMQRDVYGDDPLTLDVVEPVKPAEFTLLINNKGYGDATDVRMVTQQPEIVDNLKGLHINFELISSQVNGAPATLSFGQTITNNFGTIPAHSQMYAQWWLTSSLLGHFTDYDVQATHVTSYGNEDLSLLDQVTIHELIHGFDLSTEEQQLRAFLVNDLPDSEDQPDMLYFSDGETADVSIVASSAVEKTSSTTCTLTIVPSATGWNYGNLLDPTHGMATIQSIVRQSDGKEISADNFWQTDRTLRDGSDPLYENRLHFIDDFASQSAETYIITFNPVPDVLLEVESIAVVPDEDTVAEDPVDQLTVTFSKPIDPLTFTGDDIAFVVQGTKQDASQIGITTEDNRAFVLDLKTLTEQCPNGYYTLTVQTADITDNEGYQGKTGKQVGWILYRGGLVQLLTSVYPLESGSIQRAESAGVKAMRAPAANSSGDTAEYGSIVTLTATPADGFEFLNWTLNGEVVSTDPEFTAQAIGDMNVVANFTKKNYLVEVASENGMVSGTATGYYQHGDQLTFTAEPDADYVFTGWTVNGEDAGTDATLTLTLDKVLDVKANFVRDIYHQRLSFNRGWNWVSSYLSEPQSVDILTNSSSRVLAQFDELIRDPEYGLVGGITAFEPAVAYKVNASSAYIHILNGHLYDLTSAPMTVKRGWNWIAYPYWQTRAVDDVLINSEEGDYITGQTGFTEYADGYWQGSLIMLEPGAGYMYKSASDKVLAFDFEEKEEAGVKGFRHSSMTLAPIASPTANVDIHQYPNTMNMTATLTRNGEAMNGEALIYAFAGDELRGVSRYVGSNYYLTVYGEQPVEITFIVEDTTTGELATANETLTFRNDVIGSRRAPYVFTIGDITGLDTIVPHNGPMTVYSVDGRLISNDATMQSIQRLPKGIYIVNGHKRYVK